MNSFTKTHAFHAELRHKLDQYGIVDLKPEQIAPIEAALMGEDCLAIMPTGSGKSLCFQLPAWVQNGVTLVISPLLALIRDQVQALQGLGFPAFALHSELSSEEWGAVISEVQKAQSALLYLSPEQFSKHHIQSWLSQLALNRVVVDEAHCVSEWGQSFRPSYREIGALLDRHPHIARSAFTATASLRVIADIEKSFFSHRKVQNFFQPIARKNITLNFQRKTNQRADIFNQIQPNENIVIYASTRQRTEILAQILQDQGYRAHHYHAGLNTKLRQEVEAQFLQGGLQIVVATNAFGMGVDKPDIDKVIHADLPINPESYVQEIGRAGRDGRSAQAYCLFSEHDYEWRKEQILTQIDDEYYRQIQQDKLDWFYNFACKYSQSPRSSGAFKAAPDPWQSIAAYFSEEASEPAMPAGEEALETILKRWRYLEARRKNLSLKRVLPDEVLDEILQNKPQSIDELAKISGIGVVRLREYGDELVQFFHEQSPSTGTRRQKIALSGDGALYDQLESLALDLKYGESGTEKPLALSQRQIMQLAQSKPQNPAEFLRVLGNKHKLAERFSKRMLLAIRENSE